MDQANGLTVNSSRFNLAGGMRIPEPRIRAKPHCALAHKEYDDGMNTLLAVISGSSLINCLIWVVIAGVVFWLATWLISYIGVPEPFAKICKVILAVFVFIVLVNALMSLAGKPLIAF